MKCQHNLGIRSKHNQLVVATHLKNMPVKLDDLPNFQGENKKYLKPPPKQRLMPGFNVTFQKVRMDNIERPTPSLAPGSIHKYLDECQGN